MAKVKKLSKRKLAAQQRMDDALFDIICAANLFAAAEKDFYGRKPRKSKAPKRQQTFYSEYMS
jgi:hypothetical protein